MIISAKDCWEEAKLEHSAYFDLSVKKNINSLKLELPPYVFNFLVDNHIKIRDGNTNDFRLIHDSFSQYLSLRNVTIKSKILNCIKKIYNYSSFSSKNKKGWNAYSLCLKCTIKTCPYCQLAYGHTLIKDSEGKVRPTLDHYYDKDRYPMFAISLGNLVPSCYTCNSSLKNITDFYTKKYLNPLESEELLKIILDVDPIQARSNLTLFDNAKVLITHNNHIRAKNSLEKFCLEAQYQFHVSTATSIAKDLITYDSYNNNQKILSWILRGVDKDNYRNIIMGKMIMDLFLVYGNKKYTDNS